jgi:hypothetical protein
LISDNRALQRIRVFDHKKRQQHHYVSPLLFNLKDDSLVKMILQAHERIG